MVAGPVGFDPGAEIVHLTLGSNPNLWGDSFLNFRSRASYPQSELTVSTKACKVRRASAKSCMRLLWYDSTTSKTRSFSIFRRSLHASSRSSSDKPTELLRGLSRSGLPFLLGQRIELSGDFFVPASSGRHFAHYGRLSRLISAALLGFVLTS